MRWLALVPGVGPLAAAGIGAHAGLLGRPEPLEPEIPSAMDDWDREFEERTGALPSFSRLIVHRRAVLAVPMFTITGGEVENPGDALSFAGKRR